MTSNRPTFERRHFNIIAGVIRDLERDGKLVNQWHVDCAVAFADELRSTNPTFNRARFLEACGVDTTAD